MEKKTVSNRQLTFSPTQNPSVTSETNSRQTQKSIEETVSSFSAENALKFLDSIETETHEVLCLKASMYMQLQKEQQSLQHCARSFFFPSDCKRCVALCSSILSKKSESLSTIQNSIKKLRSQFLVSDSIAESLDRIFASIRKGCKFLGNDPSLSDLVKTCQEGHVEFPKLAIVEKEEGNRTVMAKEPIEKDETILYVPLQKMITRQHATNSETVQKIRKEKLYLKSPKHCELTVFLSEQKKKGKQSPYFDYIQTLPQSFRTFPINFRHDQLKLLKGSPFLDAIEQRKIDMRSDYESICELCPTYREIDFESFCRFRLIVSSRIFGIQIGEVKTDALVPIADMLNHSDPKQTQWFYSDTLGGFVIKSLVPIPEGQEIYDTYGLKCNSRFLLNYGFTLADNEANQLLLKIHFENGEGQNPQIYREVTLKVRKDIKSRQFQQMMSVLRSSIKAQQQDCEELTPEQMRQTPFADIQTEYRVWQKFEQILHRQLSEYPTTVKEDAKILRGKDIDTNHYNCVMLRMGEKEIIHYYLKMAKSILKLIKNGVRSEDMEPEAEYSSYLQQFNLF